MPSCVFNGLDLQKGGSAETYVNYASRVANEAAWKSPLKIETALTLDGADLDVSLTLTAMPDTSFTGLNLTVVVVEHETENPWTDDPPTYSFVARDLSVETVNISGDVQQERTAAFTLDATWVTTNIYVVAFLQEAGQGEVLQSAMKAAN